MNYEDRFKFDLPANGKTKLETQHDIRLQYLLCNALEGGSNYWYRIDRFNYPEGKSDKDVEFAHLEVPFMKGGSLLISTNGEHPNPDRKDGKWTLNLVKLREGWVTMRHKYPTHYDNAVRENDDAETGDVYLQCCLFGEVIFG